MNQATNMFKWLGVIPAYGFVRKIPIVWDANIERYDVNTHTQTVNKMLLSEKVVACTLGALLSPWLFLVWGERDMSYLEVKLRGLAPESYGVNINKPRTIADIYTFS